MLNRKPVSLSSAVPIALIILVASILCAKAGQDVTVKVPFDFQAGDTHFAPGEYLLSMDKVSSGSVMVRSADGGRSVILLTRKSISASVQSAPVVSFRSYGESRFLSAIQGDGAGQRWEIVPSAVEMTMARTSEQPMVASFKASSSDTDTATGTK